MQHTIQTRYGSFSAPVVSPALAQKLNITCHWTAGGYKPGMLDRTHYNVLIDGEAKLVQAVPIERQIPSLRNGLARAEHTHLANSYNIGFSICAMAGADYTKAIKGDYGPTPIHEVQVYALIESVAQLAAYYEIPVTPERILGHEEWDSYKNVVQRGKWDICCLPHLDMRPALLDNGTYESMNWIRERIARRVAEITKKALPTPAPAPAPVEPELPKPDLTELNEHLKNLYDKTPTLGLSQPQVKQAISALNKYNSVLVEAGLK